MLTVYDKLSCDSHQKWKQRHHGCFKRFNIVCGHKTVAHLSVLHFWGACQCSAKFASVSEAVSEQWHRLRSEEYKERIIFEYGGRKSRSSYSFQGLSLDVWIHDLQSPAFPPPFVLGLYMYCFYFEHMLNFALFTVYGEESHLPLNLAYELLSRNPPPLPSIFLFPASQILLLHTDLYLNYVSLSMKLIPLSIHSYISLSYDRSKASSNSSSPHSAI